MKRFNSTSKNLAYLTLRWISPIADPLKLIRSPMGYYRYFKNLTAYTRMAGSEKVSLVDTYPVFDESKQHPFDSHYFYQDAWAASRIMKSKAKSHVDIGSNLEFVGVLTAFTKVTFVDIRPLAVSMPNFNSVKGSIINLPYKKNSLKSISCLHVAEHIGLGRYGEPLDPNGTMKACGEITRVLAKGGNLFFSLPVGKPRLCFNAHRIHSPKKILYYFKDLVLKELSGVSDTGEFIKRVDIKILEKSDYACGLFWFTKR